MKRPDQSQKEIDFKKSHKRELEKLRELQTSGRLAIRWLKERFGEKGESSRESRQGE
jgi:hypothetical protein